MDHCAADITCVTRLGIITLGDNLNDILSCRIGVCMYRRFRIDVNKGICRLVASDGKNVSSLRMVCMNDLAFLCTCV
jgi:hypothetical protein